ncbi:MAG: hypothetical protein KAU62_03360 [Candidatus Heimdallarchaeota archaeon]|nr:hypothetical protein [Candidatus Heimdallarchaeota archaeon]MCG3255102.1 hypothetical protein [Candidatus Heimdallarchaeota archaeon]MCK4610176.1 hypothetical protein [Candidatus Heimdallarchaeota archaeon]
MKRILIFSSGVLLLIFLMALISPVKANATWGFETDKTYAFELKQLNVYGASYVLGLKQNTTMKIVFTDTNDTGYSYNKIDFEGTITPNSTVFVPVEVAENVTFVMPQGLPIALPLSYGLIPDYLAAFGQFINETNSNMMFGDLLFNMTDFGNITYMDVYSIYNENYLYGKLDLFATVLNETTLTNLMAGFNTGEIGFFIPTIITDFKLNATIAYNATSGLFDYFKITIRSISEYEGHVDNFDVDIKYGLYIPPPPYTPTPTPTPTNFPWLVPIAAISLISSGLVLRRKKK